jgi:hypothetical protein
MGRPTKIPPGAEGKSSVLGSIRACGPDVNQDCASERLGCAVDALQRWIKREKLDWEVLKREAFED